MLLRFQGGKEAPTLKEVNNRHKFHSLPLSGKLLQAARPGVQRLQMQGQNYYEVEELTSPK